MTIGDELKRVVNRAKDLQKKYQDRLLDFGWIEDARKVAEKQAREVKKLVKGDLHKVKSYLEKERREIEKLQKRVPSEIKKIRKDLMNRKKDLEKLLKAAKDAAVKEARSQRKAREGKTKAASTSSSAS